MAGLEQFAINIYHEKQEPGSALCAQHALNSLLQGSYFSPSDLSAIAHSLDSLEQHVDRGRLGRASANMDDTGFFSIQVLENALHVWGQSLIRWRSEAMQPHQDRPQYQRAFILNCDQHWFTLRRFGNSEGSGPWFNLDSSLDRPKWISETYLGIWLQQAEAEGYSTFVVVPANLDNPLPQTDADLISVSLPSRGSTEAQPSTAPYSPRPSAGFEDDDFELQAALQASLGGAAVRIPMPQPHAGPVAGGTRAIPPALGLNIGFPTSPTLSPPPVPHPSTRPVDQPMSNPVAASMARNQVVLERMRREQEAALREHYHDEVSRFEQMPTGNMSRFGIGSHVNEEEEQLRRAIAESEEMARGQGLELGRAQTGSDDAETWVRSDNTQQAEALRHDRIHGGRVYDDEDAELQAALQASLETAPPGIHTPTPPRTSDSPMRRSPAVASRAAPRLGVEPSNDTNVDGDVDDDDDLYYDDEDTATEETLSDSAGPQQIEDVNMEEMRRRRLARFGGGPQT